MRRTRPACDDAKMSPVTSAAPGGVQPGAEPFSSDGGPVGVLVCHGFTGSPRTIRPWAEHLAAAGYTVRAPRLPGHGTSWQDLARTGWQDWYGEVERAFGDLAANCGQVFVTGLSMGACLAFRLAQAKGGAVSGIVVVNPSLAPDTRLFLLAPALKHVIPSLPGIAGDIMKPGGDEGGYKRVPVRAAATLPAMWKLTARHLPEVTQPVLVYRSAVDHVVGPASMAVLKAALPNAEVRPLPNSYHVATLDNDAPTIFAGTAEFIREHATTAHGSPEKRVLRTAAVTNGDVPETPAGGDGDEAAWLDLIARFDAPAPGADGNGPWPEREDLAGPVHVTPIVPEALPREPPADPSEQPSPRRQVPPDRQDAPPAASPGKSYLDYLDEEHYVPPSPPPLPKLDPVTKGAWLALFGGPLYLLIATAVGWSIPGLAAFLAVAAFVGGFAVLVLRMDSGGPRDSGPDDGAVV
jgi:carboxylesterase